MMNEGWAVVANKWGGVFISTVRHTRREAIKAATEGSTRPWSWWKRKHGYAVRRVTVRVLP